MDELVFRKVTAADRSAVEEITRHTWDRADYIPKVFDAWLADESGAFVAAEWEGRLSAIGKVTFLTPDEAWLEGLRVAPDLRGRGIARRLTDYEMQLAMQQGARTIRYATSSTNETIHKIANEQGMGRVAGFVAFTAPAVEGTPRAEPLSPDQVEIAWRSIQRSEAFRASHGLYDIGFKWEQLSLELLTRETAYCWRVTETPFAHAIVARPDEERLRIGWLGGSPEKMPLVAHDLQRLAHALGFPEVSVMLPDLPDLRATFQEAGYTPWEYPSEVWIFERVLVQPSPDDEDAGGA